MKTTAGGLIHVRVGSFPIGLWYHTVGREGVFAVPFDKPGDVYGRLVKYGVKAPEAVHRAIMTALRAGGGTVPHPAGTHRLVPRRECPRGGRRIASPAGGFGPRLPPGKDTLWILNLSYC